MMIVLGIGNGDSEGARRMPFGRAVVVVVVVVVSETQITPPSNTMRLSRGNPAAKTWRRRRISSPPPIPLFIARLCC